MVARQLRLIGIFLAVIYGMTAGADSLLYATEWGSKPSTERPPEYAPRPTDQFGQAAADLEMVNFAALGRAIEDLAHGVLPLQGIFSHQFHGVTATNAHSSPDTHLDNFFVSCPEYTTLRPGSAQQTLGTLVSWCGSAFQQLGANLITGSFVRAAEEPISHTSGDFHSSSPTWA